VAHAILAGDAETGVTSADGWQLDHGPILATRPMKIGVHDDAAGLTQAPGRSRAQLLVETLERIEEIKQWNRCTLRRQSRGD